MYRFYMGGMLLPVTPAQLKVKVKNKNKTITLINDGDINILKPPGLSEISFTAILPNVQHSFAQYESGFQGAEYFLSRLEALKTSQKPFAFLVTRDGSGSVSSFNSNFEVSLESYEIEEDAKKHGRDVQVKINLLQYRSYATKIITFKKEETGNTVSASESRPAETAPKEATYTVASGDSLWNIAKRKLGDGGRYGEIYELNKDTIEAEAKKRGLPSSSNGHWIYTGTVLKLPAAQGV